MPPLLYSFMKNMASSNFKQLAVHLILVFIALSSSSFGVFSATLEKLFVPSSSGPQSSSFDPLGEGPYTGVTDGRILKYNKARNAFDFYAVTAPNRPGLLCNGSITSLLASICGRPASMAFNNVTNQLYVADVSRGLVVVPPGGGQGELVATSANGTPFRFVDGLDIDRLTGIVYFIDSSSNGGINLIPILVALRDSSGRLLKYDPTTKQATVLLSGLVGPVGVAISNDSSYLLFTEFTAMRVQKYWLTGPKANTAEIILNLTAGNPANIRITSSGDFWIAVTVIPLLQLTGIKIDGFGNVLQTISFSPKFLGPSLITDVKESGDALYLGNLDGAYLGVYRP